MQAHLHLCKLCQELLEGHILKSIICAVGRTPRGGIPLLVLSITLHTACRSPLLGFTERRSEN